MRFFTVFVFVLLALQGLAQKPAKTENPKPLFLVSNVPVSAEEFSYIYRKNNQAKADEFTEEKIRQYLDLFINFKLKVTEAKARGLDTTRAFEKEFKSYRNELKKPYIASADELDKLVKEAYDRLKQEVRASHILVSVQPDAAPADTLAAFNKVMDIRKKVEAGEAFDKVAREISEDPTAKQNGGDLGYFTAMQMVYSFEDAAYKLNTGELSKPVRTRFGYHLIKMIDKRDARGEVEVSHILLRGNDDRIKNKVFEVYDQWKAGRKWEELCSEFSDDSGTKNSGGRLRPFGVGALASVPEFEAVAFSLQQPGDVSDPFHSAIGWHIVKLEKKIPLPSFQELEPSLKRRVSRDERLQLTKSIQLAKRKKDFGFSEDADTKEKLFGKADTTLQKGRWKTLQDSSMKSRNLFWLQSKPVSVVEFFSFVSENQHPSALAPAAYVQQLYDQFVDAEIGEMEDEKLQRENADYRNLLNEYREGILLFSIMETEVWNKASEDTVGQRNFYERNQSRYKAGERVRARIFATSDKSFVEAIKQKVSKGDTLTEADLKKFKSVQNFRAYEKGDNKAIDKVSWAVGLHETEVEGMHYLVEVDRLIPAGEKSYEEARANVISDFQDELEKQWLVQLRAKYPVKVNKKQLKAVIAQLQRK